MAIQYGFQGRVALVTGGASGIGAAVVSRLEALGAEVHVFDLGNGDDVTDSSSVASAVEKLPRLDVLVCAAGVGGDSLHTEAVSDEEWRRVHAVNLDGVFYANRAAIPKMKAGGYGRIVNVASIAGKEGNPMAGAYSSSKAAVIGLTKAIGKDVAGTGILVNAIAPAVINTPMLGQLSEEHISYMTSRIPLARMGEPSEVAALGLLACEPGDDVLDGSVLRHLGRKGDVLSTVDARVRPAGLNYVGGAWVEASGGETYPKQSPMRPAETTGVFQSSTEADAIVAVAAAEAAFETWGRLPMAAPRRLSLGGGRRARGARRADRARHERGDGEAAAGGAR